MLDNSDIKEFTKIICGIALNFGKEPPGPLYDIWFDLFSADNISIDQIRHAARQIIRTRKYNTMPTYADFIDVIEGGAEDQVEVQAGIVLNKIREIGSYGTPFFDDPITEKLFKRRFNWETVCGTVTKDTEKWFVKEFKDAYLAYKKQATTKYIQAPEKIKQLTGVIGHVEYFEKKEK